MTLLVSLAGTSLVIALLRSYRRSSAGGTLHFRPEDLGGYSHFSLILSSLSGLYLELLLIRWISSEIRVFAYFKNFVLIACFLGFGLGCYLCRRRIPLLALLAPLIFFSILISLPWNPLRDLMDFLPVLLGGSSEMFIWGTGPQIQPGLDTITSLLYAVAVTLPIFALVAITFVPLGQLIGWYIERAPNGIRAYSLNVGASLAGIALYTALCFASLPPVVWFGVGGGLIVTLLWKVPRLRLLSAAGFLICVVIIAAQPSRGSVYWSPYQQLSLSPRLINGEVVAYDLQTNKSWYQQVIDLSDEFVQRYPSLFGGVPIDLNAYNLPYRFAPQPRSVLVLGAGMGNDVAAALRNGAGHVTAVEIDPLIVDLGRQLHFERPYDSPKVETIIDDARSYIQNTTGRFDLIVFSLLDSHTTSSHFSNIRIDNYVYTREAFATARRLLTPDGLFIVKFQVNRPWIAGRLHDLMLETFEAEPLQVEADPSYTRGGRFFISGDSRKIAAALEDPAFARWLQDRPGGALEHVTIPTDDWPYFYQREPGLPLSVVTISLMLILVSFAAATRLGVSLRSLRYEFFLLGAGFLLLEAQIISRMALLFGTTWVVNSIVIAVILTLILAANGIVAIAPRINLSLCYLGIIATIAVVWLIPPQAFFLRSFALKAVISTLVFCLPVFFAGLIFIRRFKEAGFSAEAFGSNLLGALAGGIAESLSLWAGQRSLLALAAAFYLGAWLVSTRRQTAEQNVESDFSLSQPPVTRG